MKVVTARLAKAATAGKWPIAQVSTRPTMPAELLDKIAGPAIRQIRQSGWPSGG